MNVQRLIQQIEENTVKMHQVLEKLTYLTEEDFNYFQVWFEQFLANKH